MCLALQKISLPIFPLSFAPFAPKAKGKSIYQPFHLLLRIVFPANACGSRARGLERELKGIVATHKKAQK
jgi:hypothetical protein